MSGCPGWRCHAQSGKRPLSPLLVLCLHSSLCLWLMALNPMNKRWINGLTLWHWVLVVGALALSSPHYPTYQVLPIICSLSGNPGQVRKFSEWSRPLTRKQTLDSATHSLYEIFSWCFPDGKKGEEITSFLFFIFMNCAQAKGCHWSSSILTYIHPGGDRGDGRAVSIAIVPLRLSLRFSDANSGSFLHLHPWTLHTFCSQPIPGIPLSTTLCTWIHLVINEWRAMHEVLLGFSSKNEDTDSPVASKR